MSSKPDIMLSLGMFGINVIPTYFSRSYHSALRPYIQGLRLKFFFYKVAKNMDPSLLLLLLLLVQDKE